MLTGANRNLAALKPSDIESLKRRLAAKVTTTPDGCHLFTGADDGNGYGKLCVQENGRQVYPRAHVLSWLLTHGSIPGRLDVCHSCNVKRCVNPDHLYVATRSINVQHAIRDGLQPCRLTDIEVAQIRELWDSGEFSQHQLARLYGIDQPIVYRIVHRKAFRWVV